MSGKIRRMRRIFAGDGRTIILAMDHAAPLGPVAGLERPDRMISTCVSAGVDCILTTYGTATRYAEAFDGRGLILRLIEGQELGVTDALRAGADGVMSMYFVGEGEKVTSSHTGELSRGCSEWGLPLTVEVLGRSEGNGTGDMPWLVAKGSRAAFELGADMIKTLYTGDPESFSRVVEGAQVPVVVLGGQRTDDDTRLLQAIRDALDAGASGVAIGRNIWQHERPAHMVQALSRLVHEDATVEQAARELVPVLAAGPNQ